MAAFDGAFDKFTSFEETGVMVDVLVEDYPGLEALLGRLRSRISEELHDELPRRHVVLGGAVVLLALIEYARAEDMRRQFPDATTRQDP